LYKIKRMCYLLMDEFLEIHVLVKRTSTSMTANLVYRTTHPGFIRL